MADHPTLLRYPNDQDFPSRTEEVLPGLPADYLVEQGGEVWKVTAVGTGKLVYWGPGPVEVVRSPAPF